MKSFSRSWWARSSPRSPAQWRRPSRSRRRATTRSAPRPRGDWLVWSRSRERRVEPVRPLRPARDRPRFQGQPEGHPGLRRRDRRDEAPLPADPRPVRDRVRPPALRPPDETAEAAPRRSQHEELGVLRDDLRRLDPLQPRARLRHREAARPPPQPRHRRAARARPPAQPQRPPQRRPDQRELRRVGSLRPVSALRHLPVRPGDAPRRRRCPRCRRRSPTARRSTRTGRSTTSGARGAAARSVELVKQTWSAGPRCWPRCRRDGTWTSRTHRRRADPPVGDVPTHDLLRHRRLPQPDVGHLPRRRSRPAAPPPP